MSLHAVLKRDSPLYRYFSSSVSNVPPPAPFQISIGDRVYSADLNFEPYRREAYRHRSLPGQRESLNFDNIGGENVVNTSGLWRRNARDWSRGAGQLLFDDRKDNGGGSVDNRFYESKGVNPWTQWQLTLQQDTIKSYSLINRTSLGDNFIRVLNVAQYRYFLEHDSLYYIDTAVTSSAYLIGASGDNYIGAAGYNAALAGSGQYLSDISGTGGFSAGTHVSSTAAGGTTTVASGGTAGGATLVVTSATGIAKGSVVTDTTHPSYLPANVYVTNVSGTTITLSANIVTTCNGDTLVFGQSWGLSANLAANVSAPVLFVKRVTDLASPGSAAAYYTSMTSNGAYVFLAGGTYGIAYVPIGVTTGALKYATTATINGGPTQAAASSANTNGQNTLTLAAAANPAIQIGSYVIDQTNPTYISPGTYVTNINSTTVTLSQNIAHTCTSDTMAFTNTSGDQVPLTAYGSVFWAADNLWATAGASATACPYILNFGGSSVMTGSGNVPTYLNLQPVNVGANWNWSHWAVGDAQIYVGGNNVTSGIITDGGVYRISQQIQQTTNGSVVTTSTSWAAPTRALALTPGEWCTALFPYLNYIFVGTNMGARMCRTLSLYDPTATATGDLEGGPLIPNITQPVTLPVTSFTAHGQYIYFAWNDYDSVSTGLGRGDVTQFIDTLAPAYASDLMVTGQGNIHLDWDQLQDAPLICVTDTTSAGIYSQSTACVPTGYVDSGWVTFDIPEDKTILWFQPQVSNQEGTLGVSIAPNPDSGPAVFTQILTQIATLGTQGEDFQITPPITTDKFRVKVNLNADTGDTDVDVGDSESPVLTRWTVRALPKVTSETEISAVIDLKRVVSINDNEYFYDPYAEFIYLENLRRSQTVVQFTEGKLYAPVVIDSIDWLPEKQQDQTSADFRGFEGLAVVYMKTIGPYAYTA